MTDPATCPPASFLMAPTDRKILSCTMTGRSGPPVPAPPDMTPHRMRPVTLAGLSPSAIALLKEHFWCDFNGVVPLMVWDDAADD